LLKERSSREEVVMTTQHAPHTPPLWRKFLSLPHTLMGWWAIGLATPALAWIVLEISGWPLFLFPEYVGSFIGITAFLVGLPGGGFGLVAVGQRDLSWLVWVSQVPAFLVLAFYVWASRSSSIGHDASVWVTLPISILLWALLNVGIILFSIFFNRYVDTFLVERRKAEVRRTP
jgi:hypothetical protein